MASEIIKIQRSGIDTYPGTPTSDSRVTPYHPDAALAVCNARMSVSTLLTGIDSEHQATMNGTISKMVKDMDGVDTTILKHNDHTYESMKEAFGVLDKSSRGMQAKVVIIPDLAELIGSGVSEPTRAEHLAMDSLKYMIDNKYDNRSVETRRLPNFIAYMEWPEGAEMHEERGQLLGSFAMRSLTAPIQSAQSPSKS